MSSHSSAETGRSALRDPSVDPVRIGALWSALVLTGAYVSVLRSITRVVGATDALMAVVVGALVAGTVVGWALSARIAVVLAAGVALGGIAAYVLSVPEGVRMSLSVAVIARDVLALATGLSVLRMVDAGMWAVCFVPAPAFLSWCLVVRRRYAAGSAVGMLALAMLILTGDAGLLTALVGVLGAAATVGLGELDRRGASLGQADVLAVVLSLMVIAPLSVTAVPSGGGGGWSVAPAGEGESRTLDGTRAGTAEQMSIRGLIELSSEVRFTVETDDPAYWRTGAYDRYTGNTWIRSGESRPYDGSIEPPPGDTETLVQTVEVRDDLAAMPAAWQPVAVDGDGADRVRVTHQGGLQPDHPLSAGDRYTVVSERPDPSIEQLRAAGTDYPATIERRYTQLPGDTPDRVGEYTASLTAEADGPYERASIVEDHLRSEWNYTLDAERPEGDVAEAVLFERDAAYCTYFATTMAVMLRTQGVPARFVTGYTEGERVGEDRYVVRGLNAHAWVEVYFPEVGWVAFDPTPPSRDEIHGNIADPDADDDGEGSDAAAEPSDAGDASEPESESATGTLATADGSSSDDIGEAEGTADRADLRNGSGEADAPADEGAIPVGFGGVDGPSREVLAVIGALAVGLIASAHRIGAVGRLAAAIRRPGRTNADTPEATVERAYERLERSLARERRERHAGESVRTYTDALVGAGTDDRIERVVTLYERSRYGPGVDGDEAREAVALVDSLTDDVGGRDRDRNRID